MSVAPVTLESMKTFALVIVAISMSVAAHFVLPVFVGNAFAVGASQGDPSVSSIVLTAFQSFSTALARWFAPLAILYLGLREAFRVPRRHRRLAW